MDRRIAFAGFFLCLSACTSTTEMTPATTATPVEVQQENPQERAIRAGASRLAAAWGYMQSGNYDRAKEHLEAGLKHTPDNADLHAAYGFYYDQVGQLPLAEKHFLRALKLAPSNGDVLNQYGVYLCRQSQFGKAIETFEKAVSLPSFTNVGTALENAGLCALRNQDKVKAEAYFQRALRQNGRMSAALLEMADLALERRQFALARQYWRRFQDNGGETARSLWIGLQIEHALVNKDSVASLGLKLEHLFPDSEEAAQFIRTKEQWLK